MYKQKLKHLKRLQKTVSMLNLDRFGEMGVKAFQPDLVVLLGDTCSEYQECKNYTLLHKEALERILKPILKTDIPLSNSSVSVFFSLSLEASSFIMPAR